MRRSSSCWWVCFTPHLLFAWLLRIRWEYYLHNLEVILLLMIEVLEFMVWLLSLSKIGFTHYRLVGEKESMRGFLACKHVKNTSIRCDNSMHLETNKTYSRVTYHSLKLKGSLNWLKECTLLAISVTYYSSMTLNSIGDSNSSDFLI